MASRARAEHPNISHRPQQSVPEEFSAPLELSQPLSGLVDGRISALPGALMGTRALGEGAHDQPRGLVIPNGTVLG